MLRIIVSVVAVLSFLLLPVQYSEASQTTGYITYLWQHYELANINSAFLFRLDTSVPLGCNSSFRYAVDATKPEGKAVMAIVLMAQARGKSVTVVGKSVCDVHGDAETVSWIAVNPN